MRQIEVPTLTTDIPDLPTRYSHAPDLPDYEDLVFSPEDKEALDRGAHLSKAAVERGLAGDLSEMRRLHVVRWETVR